MDASTAKALLVEQVRYAVGVVDSRLVGLTEDEFLWEPVDRCWSLREHAGMWILEVEYPDPPDPPLTTIAWRLAHCSIGMNAAAAAVRGDAAGGVLRVPNIELERPFEDGLSAWRSASDHLQRALASADEESLARRFAAPWAPAAFTPAWWFVTVLGLHEVVHHGAEIGCLRDLYRLRSSAV